MSEEIRARLSPEVARTFDALMQEHDEAILALLMITQRKAAMEAQRARLVKMAARYGGFMGEDEDREIAQTAQAIDALSRELDQIKEKRSRTSQLMAELVHSNRPPTPPTASHEASHVATEAFKAEVDRRFQKYDKSLEQEREKVRQLEGKHQELEGKYQELLSKHESLKADVKKQESYGLDSRKQQEEIANSLKSFTDTTKQSLEQLRSDFVSDKTSVDERLQKFNQQVAQVSSQIEKRATSGQTILHQQTNGLSTDTSLEEIVRRLRASEETLRSVRAQIDRTSLKESARLIFQQCMKMFENHEVVMKLQNSSRTAEEKITKNDERIASVKQELLEIASLASKKYEESEAFVAEVEKALIHTAGELAKFNVNVMAKKGSLPPLKIQLSNSSKANGANTPVSAMNTTAVSSRLDLGKGLFEGPPKPAKRPRAE